MHTSTEQIDTTRVFDEKGHRSYICAHDNNKYHGEERKWQENQKITLPHTSGIIAHYCMVGNFEGTNLAQILVRLLEEF